MIGIIFFLVILLSLLVLLGLGIVLLCDEINKYSINSTNIKGYLIFITMLILMLIYMLLYNPL